MILKLRQGIKESYLNLVDWQKNWSSEIYFLYITRAVFSFAKRGRTRLSYKICYIRISILHKTHQLILLPATYAIIFFFFVFQDRKMWIWIVIVFLIGLYFMKIVNKKSMGLQKEDFEKDIIYLVQFPVSPFIRSISPFALKLRPISD